MKTKLFFFAMLVSVASSAQSHISIQMLSATYTSSPAVKFRVSWSSVPIVTGQTHNAKIWVWIDYLKVNVDNTTSGNTWTRAEITTTPAVSSSPASTASLESGNNKGFWLNGVTGSYSATVTATLSNVPANTKFNWCAYTSDCPPNVTANNGTYTLRGTPPFILAEASGTKTQTVNGSTIATNAVTITPVTITDKTGCPGVFCIYKGSDLFIDATHLCQQRTSGAGNWQAYIRDSRDSEIYRIVLMPDNKWWLAQNVRYAGTGSSITISGCTPEICGRLYSNTEFNASHGGSSGVGSNKQGVCPNGWVLPIQTEWETFYNSISATTSVVAERLRENNSTCSPKTDYYGWANQMKVGYNNIAYGSHWRSNSATNNWTRIDHQGNVGDKCNIIEIVSWGTLTIPVRCLRTL